MATVSRYYAVAKIGPLEFGGFIAWLAWLVLHLVYLIGFKTKITTLLSWTVTFLSSTARPADDHRAAGLRAHPARTAGRTGCRGARVDHDPGRQLAEQPVAPATCCSVPPPANVSTVDALGIELLTNSVAG